MAEKEFCRVLAYRIIAAVAVTTSSCTTRFPFRKSNRGAGKAAEPAKGQEISEYERIKHVKEALPTI
jgi:hypothetical protein